MCFIRVTFFLAAAAGCLASVGASTPLHKSKEDALAALQFIQDHHVPPQVKSFTARKESRRDLSKFLSKYVKDTVLSELMGGDNTNKGGLKGKVARFLFNQKKSKMLNKMRSRNANAKIKKEDKVEGNDRRINQMTDHIFSWAKEPSFDTRTHDDAYGDDGNYYNPFTLFNMLDQLSMVVTVVNQTEYTEVVEGLTSIIGAETNIPSPEEFCGDFDVTTTEEECVGAVSAFTTLIEGAIKAPWLLRDIVGYAEAVVDEVVAWETLEGLASGILSMYGADGTVEGGLGAIRGVISDVFAFVVSVNPYYSYYIPEMDDFGGLLFDLLPMVVATETLVWDYNFLEDFGDVLYDNVYSLTEGIGYILGEGFIEMPEGPEFHADICEAFGLVPVNVTTFTSCDYFRDIKQAAILTEGIPFCVEYGQDMEDYTTELFRMENTFEISTLQEADMGWIVEELQEKNWKFDNYDFMALESMTCSIKGYLTQELECDEKPVNTFLLKDNMEKTCRWLRKQENKKTKRICNENYTARYTCPSTCCMCDEDPKKEFFRRFIEVDGINVPEIKTCAWLGTRSPENLKKFCSKSFAPPGFKVASGACPVTCGLCEGRDKCQDAIDNYIATTSWISHYNNDTYESVYFNSYGEGDYSYSYMYIYGPSYKYISLGYYQGRYENTLLLDGGDYCEEEDRSISSKVIVEGTTDFGGNRTYFSQSSPCSYELKVVIYCGDNNSTNSTSFWSGRNLLQTIVEHFYPQPEDEILDWQK